MSHHEALKIVNAAGLQGSGDELACDSPPDVVVDVLIELSVSEVIQERLEGRDELLVCRLAIDA